jgi:hypothetical protein
MDAHYDMTYRLVVLHMRCARLTAIITISLRVIIAPAVLSVWKLNDESVNASLYSRWSISGQHQVTRLGQTFRKN